MHHTIHSTEIRPLVRFAGRRTAALMNRFDTWASDCRLFYFTGPVRLCVDGKEMQTEENDLLLLPPQCRYRFDPALPGEFYLVNFDYVTDTDVPIRAIPTRMSPSAAHQIVTFTDLPALTKPVYAHLAGLNLYLAQMDALYKNKYLYFRAELSACMTLVLTKIFRHLSGADSQGGIGEIIEYVRTNCAEPLTNTSIAARFHYHPGYVSRLFLLHTGQPLHRYLVACRIEKAQLLLTSTTLPAAEIAAMTGFSGPAAFSRAFHAATGCSPSDFRK